MLCSNATGFRIAHTVDLLKRFGGVFAQVENVRWISELVVPFSLVAMWDPGAFHWKSQIDRTPSLSELEDLSFKDTREMFPVLLHLLLTIHYGLFGLRAV